MIDFKKKQSIFREELVKLNSIPHLPNRFEGVFALRGTTAIELCSTIPGEIENKCLITVISHSWQDTWIIGEPVK